MLRPYSNSMPQLSPRLGSQRRIGPWPQRGLAGATSSDRRLTQENLRMWVTDIYVYIIMYIYIHIYVYIKGLIG